MIMESEKALRYIGLLDDARLHGNWAQIPELVRKVEKHAPHRKCLTLAATSEASIARASSPNASAASTSASVYAGLLDMTPQLVQAVDQEKTHFEDAFQANVCLHEIYFIRKEWSTITANLDSDVWQQVAQHTKNPLDLQPMTRVAVLKNRYFLGVAHEQQQNQSAAAQSYQSALKAVQNAPPALATASEYRRWAERLLARASLLVAEDDSTTTLSQANTALIAFRNWSSYWDHFSANSATSSATIYADFDVPRREVWARYYRLLSFILSTYLIYTSSPSSPLTMPLDTFTLTQITHARVQQRAELKRVESIYETLLLQETRFPKASQSNDEVENWAQQAVGNWQIFCGPKWRDAELGDGGKAAVSRNMLDILYRAATKTFHSTPILRNLFIVHAALAEFDLAMHAFDTYSLIITKAKSRAEKTGEHEIGLDTDDMVMLTAAQAISLLCKYGSRTEADKALTISKTLTNWLQQNRPPSAAAVPNHSRTSSTIEKTPTESILSRSALAATYRAIGQAQSVWSKLTYEPLQRKDLQAKALVALRRASDLATPVGSDPDTALLLASTLAESRDFIGAIQVLKKSLALAAQADHQDLESVAGPAEAVTQEQSVAPLWHLLSLLLTARGEYDNAVKVCEAAFEQLNGPELFDTHGTFEELRPSTANTAALIEQMEDSVKDSLIQIRITQLVLMETLESPAVAADASSSLLALYHKLFATTPSIPSVRTSTAAAPVAAPAASSAPPPQKASALKSISGSILRRKSSKKSVNRAVNASNTSVLEPTETSVAVQATNNDGPTAEKHHHHHHLPHIPHHPFKIRGHSGDFREVGNLKSSPNHTSGSDGSGLAEKSDITASSRQMSGQDIVLPAAHPATSTQILPSRFPPAQTKRHQISLLIDIWLFTAGQYMRSELFDDAEGAINEAHKLADTFQQELAKEESSARAFDERGWGCGKSVNRLWADVHAERGILSTHKNKPHDALAHFEQALSYHPDHPAAVVAISSLLLDIYEEKLAPEPSTTRPRPIVLSPPQQSTSSALAATPSPALLNRLAARDRAYLLLNTLSKLGEGYDDSETWVMLARAHELSGQVERARECLWWVVELEDGRPVRPWSVVSVGL